MVYIEGEGSYITKEYDLKTDIALNIDNLCVIKDDRIIPIEVNINSGSTRRMEIYAKESLMDYINVDEALSILSISAEPYIYFLTDKITINIYGLKLTNIIVNLTSLKVEELGDNVVINLKKASTLSMGNVNVKSLNVTLDSYTTMNINQLVTTDFEANLSKESVLNVNQITAKNSNIQISNATCNIENSKATTSKYNITNNGIVTVKGQTNSIDVNITGMAKYYGEHNVAETATIIAAGESYVEIYANKTINVIDTGAKEIRYFGDAIVTKTNILVK